MSSHRDVKIEQFVHDIGEQHVIARRIVLRSTQSQAHRLDVPDCCIAVQGRLSDTPLRIVWCVRHKHAGYISNQTEEDLLWQEHIPESDLINIGWHVWHFV